MFSIPPFSQSTMENIEQRQITGGTRSEIVSVLAMQMWVFTMYPSLEEYTGVCRMLVNKYPVLKDSIGNGIVSHCSA